MKYQLLLIVLAVSSIGYAATNPDLPSFSFCSGYDSVTGATVNGSCQNGVIYAYNTVTGENVSGTCQANGTFYGYSVVTGATVYGSCN